MLEVDLHGYFLEDAKNKIIGKIDECLAQDHEYLKIIHGYHGHIIRDFIRSYEFINFLKNYGYEVNWQVVDEGATLVVIK